jgi:integrase
MGRGRPGSGVEVLKTCVRLRFTYAGERCVETLDLKPTPANIKAAEKLAERVRQEIALDLFDYAKHFPKSERVKKASSRSKAFRDYAELYRDTVATAHSTAVTYGTAIRHWVARLGDRDITTITAMDVRLAVADVAKGLSGKTVNSYVSVLRGIFETAIADEVITANPCDKVKPIKYQSVPADPLTQDEMAIVLAHLEATANTPHALAFYEFAMATGLRPSEQIALRWGKIDTNSRKVTIDVAHVRWQDKGTKTNKAREVDLNDQAMVALQRMKPFTFMKGLDEHVFVDPGSGKPWRDNEVLRTKYWQPALKACGLRLRDAYQTRHTFATILLMAGINVAYIAKQLGHSSVMMTLKHYAKWIDMADKGVQAGKANAVFGQQLAMGTTKPLPYKAHG